MGRARVEHHLRALAPQRSAEVDVVEHRHGLGLATAVSDRVDELDAPLTDARAPDALDLEVMAQGVGLDDPPAHGEHAAVAALDRLDRRALLVELAVLAVTLGGRADVTQPAGGHQ